ncbi:MAG: hypothetical protein II208_01265 [Alphaproteobacteria bacterium]|nr:hypothetical protein [Alphaproteobacteria bacterium]
MKRVIFAILVLSLILCGCNTVPPSEESTTENFTPRNNYGELAIFTGGYRDDIWVDETIPKRYGLMTISGETVAKAIYNRYEIFELDGKKYYSMMITENLPEMD